MRTGRAGAADESDGRRRGINEGARVAGSSVDGKQECRVRQGRVAAFAKDAGAPVTGSLKDIIAGLSGVRFQAPIQKRKDKDDTDKVYTSLNRMKIKPLAAAEPSAVAAKVA